MPLLLLSAFGALNPLAVLLRKVLAVAVDQISIIHS